MAPDSNLFSIFVKVIEDRQRCLWIADTSGILGAFGPRNSGQSAAPIEAISANGKSASRIRSLGNSTYFPSSVTGLR